MSDHFIDASLCLAKSALKFRAMAFGLDERAWSDLSKTEKRIYVQWAQESLEAMRPPKKYKDLNARVEPGATIRPTGSTASSNEEIP